MNPAAPDTGLRPDRFNVLASGIAGRPVEVRAAAPGEPAWTDGTTIFIDPDAADQVTALAVQASLIAAGSLAPEVVRSLAARSTWAWRPTGRAALARRYLAVEGHRALVANGDLLPPRVQSLVDRDIAASVGSPAASLAVALSRAPIADPPPGFGVIHPKRVLAVRDLSATVAAPGDAGAAQRDARQELAEETDDFDTDDFGRLPQFFSGGVGGRGVLAWLFQRMLGLSREPEGGLKGAEVPKAARLVAGAARGTVLATGVAGTLEGVAAVKRQGTTYPEWDVHRRSYRPDWCTVTEVDPRPGDLGRPVVGDGAAALRRPLARLGLGLDRCGRRPQGDDLDIDAVVEEHVELLAGAPPDEAVYVESLKRRHDLAAVILLDISGSASMPSAPSASGRTVHEQQRAGAAALTTALHGLGNRVALYGFYSHGRSAVRMVRVKTFDDRLDTQVTRRLGGLVPVAYTRLGAAIRHGASVLEERGGTARRVLVVLSDGFAYDHGYEGPYAEADARRALGEARRRGMGCLCLSIGAETGLPALRRVFGTAAHATVARPEELARVVGPLFRDALRSTELQRRTAQRTARRAAVHTRQIPGRTA